MFQMALDKESLRKSIQELNKDSLVDIIIRQAEVFDQLTEKIEQLEKRIEELNREKHRQAAPFRVRESKKTVQPKRAGRKPGHKGSYRTIDEKEITDAVEVLLEKCPYCSGAISGVTTLEQIIEEIPPIKKQVTRVTTQKGHCAHCNKAVYSTHPLQTSMSGGSTKVQIGPRAKALGMSLQYEYGMTKRKVCNLLGKVFNISITPGGLVHATYRASHKMEDQYQKIIEELKQSAVIHSDETSWYVGSPKYWLWVFTNQTGTVYEVSNSRGREVITSMIGENYNGTLVSDCLIIYDGVNQSQQKCYSHHLKAISEAMDKADQQTEYLKKLQLLLQAAIAVKKVKADKPPDEYKRLCSTLEKQADELLLPTIERNVVDQKVANRLRKQRDHLFTFLYHDEVDATNNLAERQLRPAVIARKVSCGNKTTDGANAWQVLSSIAATANQRQTNFAQLVTDSIRVKA